MMAETTLITYRNLVKLTQFAEKDMVNVQRNKGLEAPRLALPRQAAGQTRYNNWLTHVSIRFSRQVFSFKGRLGC